MQVPTFAQRTTRRRLLAAAAGLGAATLAGLIAACGSAPPAPEPTKPAEKPAAPAPTTAPAAAAPANRAGAKAKIVWFVRTNVKENKWEDDILKQWGEKQSASDIELVVVPGAEGSTKKTAMLAAGDELSIWSPAWVGVYGDEVLRGLLHDLTDVLKRDNYDWADIDNTVYTPYEVKGRQYGMPLLSNMVLFVYNIDLFQKAGVAEPPKKWSDPAWTFDEAVKRLKAVGSVTDDPRSSVYGGIFGSTVGNGSRIYHGADYGEAGDPFTREWWTERIAEKTAWDSPEVLAFLKFRQMLYKEKISPSPETLQSLTQLGNPFLTGRVASEITGANFFGYKDIKAFKWGLAPFPHLAGKTAKSHLFVDNWSIGSKTNVFDQTWEFMKYLVSADGMKGYMLATGIFVPRKSLWDLWFEDSGYYNKDDLKQLVKDVFANSKDSENHHFAGYNELNTIINQETNLIFTLKEEPDVVAPRMKQRVEEAARQVKADIDKVRAK